jgi:periplasmic mercuric ion binding protein
MSISKINLNKNNLKFKTTIMKKLILVALLTIWGYSAQAQDKPRNAKYSFEVNGNCEMCQKRIQKAAYSVYGVKSAVWDVETHQLKLYINQEKCSPEDVKKAVAKVGHDVVEEKATEDVYNKLPKCCQYVRK